MSRPLAKILTAAMLALATLLMAGCASPRSYVVLLASPDGSVGKVAVQGQRGEQVLTQAMQGANLDGATPPFEVTPEQLQRDFGAALGARPALAEQFLLYFETGGAELTGESRALLQGIVQRALARSSVDISVIGHTDTQGRAEINEALGLQRATAIAEQLRRMGLADAVISIESHGARNLLVPTPDQTAEPRNRRVEVTLR